MTAAHCVSGFNKDRIGVTLLEHDRSKPNETELLKRKVCTYDLSSDRHTILLPFSNIICSTYNLSIQVLRIVRHAGYSPTNFNNDIGKY